MLLAVTFLGHVVAWDGERDLFRFGVCVGFVIAALNVYLWIVKRAKN